MKTLPFVTTTISANKTVAQVQAMLIGAGAGQILIEAKNGEVVGLSFKIMVNMAGNEVEIPVKMPARIDAVEKLLPAKKENWRRREQASKVAWRIIYHWTKAQLAIIDTGMVDIAEVFMPYIRLAKGDTVYEKLKAGEMTKLLNS